MTTKSTKATDAIADDHAEPKGPDQMSAWNMTRSLVAGLEQTIEKAKAEHHAKQAANPTEPHKARAEAMLVEALLEAKGQLFPDLHQIARANARDL